MAYFYCKSNQMHNIPNLFYFGTTLYMFQTVFPSIIRSLRLDIWDIVHLVGFAVEIHYDARSYKRQICMEYLLTEW